MTSPKDEFNFLNSSLWLEYSQERYLSLEEIRYRLQQQRKLPNDWDAISKQIRTTRKIGSIPLFLSSIDKKFWFFPSDSLSRKIDDIERIGIALYNRINQHASFKQDFLLNSTIEEAITSAIYEGAHSTRAQAQQLIASGNRPQSKDEWMLINNFIAMNWVQEHREQKLTTETFLKLHGIVTKNTMEGDDAHFSGKFRNDKVFVGPHEGIHHTLIEPALQETINLVSNNPRYLHPLLRGILLHYLIAYIHPFFDGNGRTARALFYFKGMRNELNYLQLLSVSAYLKEHGARYEKSFEKVVENELDITFFIDFCLDSIHAALSSVDRKVQYLLKISDLQQKLALSPNQTGLIQRMALHKFRSISIEEYAEQIGFSREIARQELKRLAELGLIEEKRDGKKNLYRIIKNNVDEAIRSD